MSPVTVVGSFRLEVIGPMRASKGQPGKGKGRPRFNKKTGRTYTPKATKVAEAEVRAIWREAGSPFLVGPISLTVIAYHSRPDNHYLADGSLGKAGKREWLPCRMPDWDNVCKLVADALNRLAYADDKQITDAAFRRRWTGRGEPERLEIVARSRREFEVTQP